MKNSFSLTRDEILRLAAHGPKTREVLASIWPEVFPQEWKDVTDFIYIRPDSGNDIMKAKRTNRKHEFMKKVYR